MKTKSIILKILDYLEEYEYENIVQDKLNFEDFLGFLNSRNSDKVIQGRYMGGEIEYLEIQNSDTQEAEIARLIAIMYRYAKHYIKKALTESQIQTPEEFSFLITLMTYQSLTKSELISKNIIEKTSGIEVIKRLIKHKLISQFDDPNDKRSQRVAITTLGIKTIIDILPKMGIASNIVSGNLSQNEKNTLSYLLKKLDFHHHHLYENNRSSSLDILSKIK